MKSQVATRCIVIRGHKTSVSLEDGFWNSLKEIAKERRQSLPRLVATIDAERKTANLSSNLRLFVLGYYQDQFNSSGKLGRLRQLGSFRYPPPSADNGI
jgi:predicted DNA-binding ribbon-helix-helix protein